MAAKQKTPEAAKIRHATDDDFPLVEAFLLQSSDLYPDIARWWKDTVIPGISSGRRIALVLDQGRGIDGLFIGKLGKHAKVCTLRLRHNVTGRGLGTALVAQGLSLLLKHDPHDIFVTVSEAADRRCSAFFEQIGFRAMASQKGRYVEGISEVVYSCPTQRAWAFLNENLSKTVRRTLFGLRPHMAGRAPDGGLLVISLRPEFADLFLAGKKTVEFRRRFSQKHEGSKVIFYASSTERRFSFTGTVTSVEHGAVRKLWSAYKEPGGIPKRSFDEYFRGVDHGYAIMFDNINPVTNAISLNDLRRLSPSVRPPQSFQVLDPRSPLLAAFAGALI